MTPLFDQEPVAPSTEILEEGAVLLRAFAAAHAAQLVADAAGHHVPADVRTPRINAFLDRTLGPVVPRRR